MLQQQQKQKADDELAKQQTLLKGVQVGLKKTAIGDKKDAGGKNEFESMKSALKKVVKKEDDSDGSGTDTPESRSRRGTVDAEMMKRSGSTSIRPDSVVSVFNTNCMQDELFTDVVACTRIHICMK